MSHVNLVERLDMLLLLLVRKATSAGLCLTTNKNFSENFNDHETCKRLDLELFNRAWIAIATQQSHLVLKIMKN